MAVKDQQAGVAGLFWTENGFEQVNVFVVFSSVAHFQLRV